MRPPPLGSTPAGAAWPRDSDSRAARAVRAPRDGPTAKAAAKVDARTAARRQVREARGWVWWCAEVSWLRAQSSGTGCEGRGLPRTLAAVEGRGVAGFPEGSCASTTLESDVGGAVVTRRAVRAPRGAGGGRGAQRGGQEAGG